jgi:Uma2 family endonuclease
MGLLDHQHRFELVEGDLIDRMGKNSPHSIALALLAIWIRRTFGDLFVLTEVSIDVSPEDNPTSEPEPDIVLLTRPFVEFMAGNAQPPDLRLVVEISDSTFVFDAGVKAGLYARAGIVEYWVLDIQGRRLVVHRSPEDGKYQSVSVYGENEPIAPLAAPESEFRASCAFSLSAL